ncbi:MAG TPA: prolipoprotein diacylglyceryl transferase [Phycisphaerae bacterium]|nr:prolipoprotein diacylglyceryl transferase [Phycisphaerae bacterium]
MLPYLLRIGQLSVPAYPVLYGLGIAAAGFVAILIARRQGLAPRKVATLVLILAGALVIGGRGLFVLLNWGEFRGDLGAAFNISEGGQVSYGGLLLAIPVGVFLCRAKRLPGAAMCDAFAVGIPLGHAIGRIGCFCRGCCFGRVSELSWAVRFPKFIDANGCTVGSPPFLAHLERGLLDESARSSLPVHPAQLYSSGVLLLLFLGMLLLWRSGRFPGRLLPVYVTAYAGARFLLELTRDNGAVFWGLTVYQILSIFIAGGGMAVLVCLHRRAGQNQRPACRHASSR